jgi:hypothetical protein
MIGELGFLTPALFVVAPLGLGVLVWVYRRKAQGKSLIVPTLFLLREFKRSSQARRQFKPPPRFFFELLCILLLTLVLAGMYQRRPATRIAVLLDNSISMGKVVGGESGETDLTRAIQLARSFIQSASFDSQVEIFVTSPTLRSLGQGLASRDKSLSTLDTVKLAYATDSIDSALSKLALQDSYEQVVAFTDRPKNPKDQSGPRVQVESIRSDNRIDSLSNIALTDIRHIEREGKIDISVTASSYATRIGAAKVTLFAVQQKPWALRKIAEQEISLGSRGSQEVRFSNLSQETSLYSAKIEPLRNGSSVIGNALSNDDRAWIKVGAKEHKIVLVGPLSPETLGLQKITFATFEHIKPEEFSAKTRTEAGRVSAYLLHRFVTEEYLDKPTLSVVPPQASIENGQTQPLSSWDATHPALRYIALATIQMPQSNILSVPNWGAAFLSLSGGPIAWSGAKDNVNHLTLGFEALPYEGKNSPLLSILLLNSLKFVLGATVAGGYVTVSDLNFSNELQLFNEDGNSALGQRDDVRPGVYQGAEQVTAVNFFESSESDLLGLRSVAVAESPEATEVGVRPRLLAPTICMFLMFLLLLDMIVGVLRRKGAVMASGDSK